MISSWYPDAEAVSTEIVVSKTCRMPRSSLSRSYYGTGDGDSGGKISASSTLTPRMVDIVSSEKSV
jgi:hypothetical protein